MTMQKTHPPADTKKPDLVKTGLTGNEKIILLRTALIDLLNVIVADDLIPESVSYMRQAREALEKTGRRQ